MLGAVFATDALTEQDFFFIFFLISLQTSDITAATSIFYTAASCHISTLFLVTTFP